MSKEPTENISVSVPISMVEILDHFCCQNDLNRSQVINRAIRLFLGTKIAKDPAFWDREYQRLQAEGKI